MSEPHPMSMSKDVVSPEFYELMSDVKDEIDNSDEKCKIGLGCPQEEPGRDERDSNSRVELQEFDRDTFQIQTQCIGDEVDIKYEVNDIQHNRTHDTEDDHEKINPSPPKRESIHSEEKELSGLISDLLQCERDCLTCQVYIRKLSEHVRVTHAADQLSHDPLHVEPLDTDKSAAVDIKCQGDGATERMDSSEESDSQSSKNVSGTHNRSSEESDSNFELEEVEISSESDPDYKASPDFNPKRKSVRKVGKDDKRHKSFQKDETVCQTKLHNTKKSFICEVCGMRFTLNSVLKIHLRIHTGEKPFQCEECGMGFTRSDVLTKHLRIHTGEKPFKCEECGKRFARKDKLKEHMMIHNGVRPFKCTNCEKCFKTKTVLNYHMRSHTGERPFECEECGKSYSTNQQLCIHRESHNEVRAYKCDICDKDFKRPDTLNKHKRKNCCNNI